MSSVCGFVCVCVRVRGEIFRSDARRGCPGHEKICFRHVYNIDVHNIDVYNIENIDVYNIDVSI